MRSWRPLLFISPFSDACQTACELPFIIHHADSCFSIRAIRSAQGSRDFHAQLRGKVVKRLFFVEAFVLIVLVAVRVAFGFEVQ